MSGQEKDCSMGDTENLYRKKPVVIEARQTGQDYDTDCEVMRWCGGHFRTYDDDDILFVIPTLEGQMEVTPGDWVIRGVAGEFYPCKPDIFAATYEPRAAMGDQESDCDPTQTENELTFDQEVAVALARDLPGVEHIWLNAFGCIQPSDEFAAQVGRVVIGKVMEQRSRHVVLRINAS